MIWVVVQLRGKYTRPEGWRTQISDGWGDVSTYRGHDIFELFLGPISELVSVEMYDALSEHTLLEQEDFPKIPSNPYMLYDSKHDIWIYSDTVWEDAENAEDPDDPEVFRLLIIFKILDDGNIEPVEAPAYIKEKPFQPEPLLFLDTEGYFNPFKVTSAPGVSPVVFENPDLVLIYAD